MRQERLWYSSQRFSSRSMAGSGVWTCTAPSRLSQKSLTACQACSTCIRVLEARGQRHRFGAVGALAEQEPHLFAAARRQVDVQLERGARIEAGLDGAAQADAAQRRRVCQAAQTAQELAAVGGQAVEALAGGSKGDALAELGMPRVARQQRLAGVVELGDHELGGSVTRDAEHPFGIEGGGDAPGALRGVFEPQLHDLDRGVRRHEQAQPLAQPVAVVFENGIARAMAHQVGRRSRRTVAA